GTGTPRRSASSPSPQNRHPRSFAQCRCCSPAQSRRTATESTRSNPVADKHKISRVRSRALEFDAHDPVAEAGHLAARQRVDRAPIRAASRRIPSGAAARDVKKVIEGLVDGTLDNL